MFLNLEGDRLPGHLQEVDGLAQRFSFQTDAINGQDSVPYVDGPGPARGGGVGGRGTGLRQTSCQFTEMQTMMLLVTADSGHSRGLSNRECGTRQR